MKYDERLSVEHLLEDVPAGHVTVQYPTGKSVVPLLIDRLQARTEGKGLVEVYPVFPGVEASYASFLACEVAVQHKAAPSMTELFYCRSGRVGWNMQGNTSLYLGAGDLTVHSAASCAHSAMMFPLEYARGISITLDWERFSRKCPEALLEANLNFERLQQTFCTAHPVSIPACEELTGIFAPLYSAQTSLRPSYLKLKIQELLLFLSGYSQNGKKPNLYFSQQTELIKDIHTLLTRHLDRRFTIEELSRRYAINTSTLKEVFKAVYGMPIATYMKEYRIRQAMILLRQTDATIAQIAEQVGYESQGKFTNAFKDVTQMLPSTYRKGLPKNPVVSC